MIVKKIELYIDGVYKPFYVPFINGMVFRKFIEMKMRMNMANLSVEEVDELADLVVYAFGSQFSREQFYEGIPHDRVMTTIDDLFLPTPTGDESGNGKK